MLKRQFITGTLVALACCSGQPVKADEATQAIAQADAKMAVSNRQPIDERALATHDEEYINAYLAAYEATMQVEHETIKEDDEAADVLPVPFGSTQGPNCEPVIPQTPTATQAKFINHLAPLAQQIGRTYDLYPSVIIAQAALESDWGCSTLSRAPYYNLFGVKGNFAKHSVNEPTLEYDAQGNQLAVTSDFRQYSSEDEALIDYATTLNDPLYWRVHRQNAVDFRAATKALVGCYATDPAYDQKLNQLIEAYQLTKYDDPRRDANNNLKALPVAEKKGAPSPASPIVNQQAATAKKQRSPRIPYYMPLLGGVGTVGVIEIIRKLILKK